MTMGNNPTILERSPLIAWAIFLTCFVILIDTVFVVPYLGAHNIILDFDAFYIVSEMIWQGRLNDTYVPSVMIERQSELAGKTIFMPWTYPPQFDLIVAPMALVSRGLAYGIFVGLTFIAYFAVLRKLAGPHLSAVMIAIMPGLVIVIWVGQNGLMTGAIVGLVCLFWLNAKDKGLAGLALGAMIIKPHLALGLGFLMLITRQWRMFAAAMLVVVVSSVLATLVFGPEVWGAFLKGTKAAGNNMERGLYPLFRMTSVYAASFTLGATPKLALILHVSVAAVAVVLVIAALRMGWPMARVLGVTIFTTLSISPYNYDYDMPVLGIGLALLAPDLMRYARLSERLAICATVWLCTGTGLFIVRYLIEGGPWNPRRYLALGGVGMVLTAILVWTILLRAHRAEKSAQA